jgi:hypothetical protein
MSGAAADDESFAAVYVANAINAVAAPLRHHKMLEILARPATDATLQPADISSDERDCMTRVADDAPVVVTGASGFIAKYVIAELLQRGYAVRGTLRDLGKSAAVVKPPASTLPSFRSPPLT